MKRRQFIKLIGGAAAGWPLSALAEGTHKPALIGYLTGAPLTATTNTRMFLQGLQDLGYVEGRDFQMTYRSSDGYQDRLPALAEELVRLKPDVIVAAGLDAVVALRNVTALMSSPAGSPAMVWIWNGAGAVPRLSWTRFCTALNRATCRSSFRRRCCCRSTSKRQRLSASLCHRLCSFGPTR